MADRTLTCSACNASITVSEFVDLTAVKCPKCKAPLAAAAAPKEEVSSAPARKLSLRKKEHEGPITLAAPAVKPDAKPDEAAAKTEENELPIAQVKERKEKARIKLTKHLFSWLLFLVLGLVMCWLRYGFAFTKMGLPFNDVPAALTAAQLAAVKPYTVYIVMAIYVMLILVAFKDGVFQGVLSFLVPMYPFYYLLGVSDNFFLRAAILGVMIGIGQDGFTIINEHILKTIDSVNAFIASGGG